MTEVIAMKNLKKNFGNKTVLNEISCTIAENEIFGLLGPSGAGKTTIINILTGQIKKTDGEATVFLTTHKMDEAMKLCDNIALLNNGVIIEYGAPAAVCRKYNIMNTVNILLKDGSTVAIPNDPESADIIAGYIKSGEVDAIHSSEPDLETVQ